MIYGHFTMYSKTIVLQPGMIAMYRNIYCAGYDSGAGVAVWDPLNQAHVRANSDAAVVCDMYVTLVPMCATTSDTQTWRSCTGECPMSLQATNEVSRAMWYEGCTAVSEQWGWKTSGKLYGTQAVTGAGSYDESGVPGHQQNVICMQQFQMRYDPIARDYTKVTIDAGHWGPQVYEGMKKVINGHAGVFEHAWYSKTKSIGLH
jgi:hypothetical protein